MKSCEFITEANFPKGSESEIRRKLIQYILNHSQLEPEVVNRLSLENLKIEYRNGQKRRRDRTDKHLQWLDVNDRSSSEQEKLRQELDAIDHSMSGPEQGSFKFESHNKKR